jgi:predicted kinase
MLPSLVIVTGPAGSGKTTLAHRLAEAIGCPAICRDEIKEGMVHTHPGFQPGPGDPLTVKTFPLFFAVLGLLIEGGASIVADAAFVDEVWRSQLDPLLPKANVRVIHCTVEPEVALQRIAERLSGAHSHKRGAHADRHLLGDRAAAIAARTQFPYLTLPVPTIAVDTSSGYSPSLEEIVALVEADRR